MNKLLISLLSLVGVSAVGTGGYFLLRRNNAEKNKPQDTKADSGKSGESGSKPLDAGSDEGTRSGVSGANNSGSGESSDSLSGSKQSSTAAAK